MAVDIPGVDYSANAIPAAALRAAGKVFVCRYLAHDWRGIRAQEVRDLTAGGIEIVANYEGTADRFRAGFPAGVTDAHFAQSVLEEIGLPHSQPIYFSCDFDAEPGDQPVIDAYLGGVASVIGLQRTGVYAGYWVIRRCVENGTAKWFWQTYAWSGGNLHPATHIYQYDNYDNTIAGTDVDLDRALQVHYGQASDFRGTPTKPVYAPRVPIPGPVEPKVIGGAIWLPLHKKRWKALKRTERRQRAVSDAALVGPDIKAGETVTLDYSVFNDDIQWFSTKSGTRVRADAFIAE